MARILNPTSLKLRVEAEAKARVELAKKAEVKGKAGEKAFEKLVKTNINQSKDHTMEAFFRTWIRQNKANAELEAIRSHDSQKVADADLARFAAALPPWACESLEFLPSRRGSTPPESPLPPRFSDRTRDACASSRHESDGRSAQAATSSRSFGENQVVLTRVRSRRESPSKDAFWMKRALAEAERGRGFVEPNPMSRSGDHRWPRLDFQRFSCSIRRRPRGSHGDSGGGKSGLRLDPLRDSGTLPPPRQNAPMHRCGARGGYPSGRGGDGRPVPPGCRWWPSRFFAITGWRVVVGVENEAAMRLNGALSQAVNHRASVCDGEMGHDARRQDRHGFRVPAAGSAANDLAPRFMRSVARWTRLSWESARHWLTTPS